MAPPPVLPSMFDAALRAGASTTPTLQLTWTGDRLEVQGEAVQLRVGWSELVSMQVSRSASQRRRWWGGDAVTHRVHAELRTRQGMRVRLSAVVSSPDRLDGLPWMEGAGIDIPEEALVGLVATAQHAGVKLVEWGEEVMKPPPAELQRRREVEERAARAARKRQRAAEKAAKAEQAEQAQKRRGRAAKPDAEARPLSRWATFGLTFGIIALTVGWIQTCQQLSMRWGLDEIKAILAIPDDPDHLLVVGENRLDEHLGTRLIVLDLRSGQEVASAVWRVGIVTTTRPATVLGELDGLLWLCGGNGEVEGWDMRTLQPKVLLTQQAGADAALREGGLLDPGWMSCAPERVRVNQVDIEFYTNQGQWVRLYAGKSGGAPSRCVSCVTASAALDLGGQRSVRWDADNHPGLSLSDTNSGEVRDLKHAPHTGGVVLRDGLTCTAAQAYAPASIFLLWRDRLDRPMNQLSRISLEGEGGELWSITAPLSEAPLQLCAQRGKLLILGQREDLGLIALDVDTGAERWRWEP